MQRRAQSAGFTLLEVLVAMSILAVGATSILSVFVYAVKMHTDRVENNRIMDLYNHARRHAEAAFNSFDPSGGKSAVPSRISADLSDYGAAMQSGDPMIREAADRFAGYRYEITFESNPMAVAGSSVVATIHIYRLSGQLDRQLAFSKEFLTRSGTPVQEFWSSPSLEKRDEMREAEKSGGSRK